MGNLSILPRHPVRSPPPPFFFFFSVSSCIEIFYFCNRKHAISTYYLSFFRGPKHSVRFFCQTRTNIPGRIRVDPRSRSGTPPCETQIDEIAAKSPSATTLPWFLDVHMLLKLSLREEMHFSNAVILENERSVPLQQGSFFRSGYSSCRNVLVSIACWQE